MKFDKIIIVGGGSAGWMTAATLIKTFPKKDITVLESPNVPIVGVGESTLATIKTWTKYLEIDDKEFLSGTNGIYKLSIKFTDFYKKGEAFHYPFGDVELEGNNAGPNDWWFKKACYPETKNNDYADCIFPSMALVNNNKLFYNLNNELPSFDFSRNTAYHFDAVKFGMWLKDNYCLPRGVKHIQEDITKIDTDKNGIKSLNKKYTADLFIDCTGFKSLLLDKTLKEPFEPLTDKLPNNKAWATRIPYRNKEEELKPYTNCTAIENGWVWNIPLWNRIGTGYVYSDKYVSDEKALKEFKKHLNRDDVDELEFKNITMRTGIHKRLFVKNVAAVGLAAGFIEPLESNGLYTVHEFLMALVRNLQREKISQWDKDNYTMQCKREFYQFAEFVGLHYALSHRDDTEYWKNNLNKEWSNELIENKPNKYITGYFAAGIDRIDFKFNTIGGLHCIAAGMNWAPSDITTLGYHNYMSKDKVKEFFNHFITRLDTKKSNWNKIVENKSTVINFLKENIYNENSIIK